MRPLALIRARVRVKAYSSFHDGLRTNNSSRRCIFLPSSPVQWSVLNTSGTTSLSLIRTRHPHNRLSNRKAHFSMSASQSWWEEPNTPPKEPGKQSESTSEEMDPDSLPPAREEELPTRRIHIMGTGSIGTLVANSLMQLPNPPPISLLMHKKAYYEDFVRGGRIVRLVTKASDIIDEQRGFDVDLLSLEGTILQRRGTINWQHIPHWEDPIKKVPTNPLTEAERMSSDEVFIYNLIVTVKGPSTISALSAVKHRVDSRTTILFMQNGLGQIDELNKEIFTDPANRPTYMLGIISHGCHMRGPYTVVHAGMGTVALGIHRDTDKFPLPPKDLDSLPEPLDESKRRAMFPGDADLYSNITARYLLRTMTRCPILACAAYPYLDLFQLQLEKLVSNCIINPLTAIFNVKNGDTMDNPPMTRVERLLLAEIALVIRGLPELEGIPNVRMRFSPSRLEMRVQNVMTLTAENSSSMREDIRLLKRTEIDYLNGYIIKRGEEQGIKCVLNYMIMQLIKAKLHNLTSREQVKVSPYEAYGTTEVASVYRPLIDDSVILEDVSNPQK